MITIYTIRIKSHLAKLETEQSRERRLRILRHISEAALDAHDVELRALESLNSVKADPQLEAAVCE